MHTHKSIHVKWTYTPVAPEEILIRLGDTVTVTNHTNSSIRTIYYCYVLCPRQGCNRSVMLYQVGYYATELPCYLPTYYLYQLYRNRPVPNGFPSRSLQQDLPRSSGPMNVLRTRKVYATHATRGLKSRGRQSSSLAINNNNNNYIKNPSEMPYNNKLSYLTTFEINIILQGVTMQKKLTNAMTFIVRYKQYFKTFVFCI